MGMESGVRTPWNRQAQGSIRHGPGAPGRGWGASEGTAVPAEVERSNVFFGWGYGGGFTTRSPICASQLGPQVCWGGRNGLRADRESTLHSSRDGPEGDGGGREGRWDSRGSWRAVTCH